MSRKTQKMKTKGRKTNKQDAQLRIDNPVTEGHVVDQTTPPTSDTTPSRSPLLALPLELRIEIYKYVLSTGEVDEKTSSPVLSITKRRRLRCTSSKARVNRYRLENFNSKYFALSRTCIQIRQEIRDRLPAPFVEFSSPGVLDHFLGDHGGNVEDVVLNEHAIRFIESTEGIIVSTLRGPAFARRQSRILKAIENPSLWAVGITGRGEAGLAICFDRPIGSPLARRRRKWQDFKVLCRKKFALGNMPPKKKKNAGNTKSQTGGRRSGMGTKKNHDQMTIAHAQIAANGDPSPATQRLNTAPNTTDSKSRNAQSQSLLFKLPPEVRVMVYSHVLTSKTLSIDTRRELRRQFRAQRHNQFTLENFNSKHFALIKTCTKIKEEIEKFVLPKVKFTFLSTDAFAHFLGGRTSYGFYLDNESDSCTSKLLEKVSGVEVEIQKHRRWYEPLEAMGWIETALQHPLNIDFIDYDRDEDYTSRACREAVRRWDERMQELKTLQAKEI
ncbi:hypothetical protein KCU98_g512, partial [Aureobasidium melanogenum]